MKTTHPSPGPAGNQRAEEMHAVLPEMLTTSEAAALLRVKPSTLLRWSCTNKGPIRPVKVNRFLLWPAEPIAALLNGGAS